MPDSSNKGVTGAVTGVTGTLGAVVGGVSRTVGGVVGAAGRGVGGTINNTTGTKAVGNGLQGLTNGVEDGVTRVAEGIEDGSKVLRARKSSRKARLTFPLSMDTPGIEKTACWTRLTIRAIDEPDLQMSHSHTHDADSYTTLFDLQIVVMALTPKEGET